MSSTIKVNDVKLPGFFCKIIDHKKTKVMGIDYGERNNIIISILEYCKRCKKNYIVIDYGKGYWVKFNK